MRKPLTFFIASAMLFNVAYAGGGMTGGSTEVTQLLNFAELTSQTTETIQQTTTQIAQLSNLQRMLTTAPGAVLGKLGLPVDNVATTLAMLNNVTRARSALEQARMSTQVFDQSLFSLSRKGALSNQDLLYYLQANVRYAQQNKTKLDSDIVAAQKAATDFQRASVDYQASAATIPTLVGTTDNLQALNATLAKQGIQMAQANSLVGTLVEQEAGKQQRELDQQAASAANTSRNQQQISDERAALKGGTSFKNAPPLKFNIK